MPCGQGGGSMDVPLTKRNPPKNRGYPPESRGGLSAGLENWDWPYRFYPPPDSARTVCQSVTAPSSKYTLNSAVLQGFFPPGGYNHTSTALPLC